MAISALLVLGGAPVRAAAPVAGATDAAHETARARLVEGVELLRRAQFAAALSKFDEAYALVPSANIQYDRGLALVGLGRDVEALEAFEAFLAHADHAPPGTRDKAAARHDLLLARVAIVTVTSDRAGADVTVDGRPRGATPLAGFLYVSPGRHEVAARHVATGTVAAQGIVVAPGQRLTVTLHLDAASARAAIAPASTAPGSTAAATPPPKSDDAHEDARPAPPMSRAEPVGARWSLAAAGIGGGIFVAGITFGLLAAHEGDALSADSRKGAAPNRPTPFVRHKEINGLRYQTIGVVCLAAGGAVLTAGIALYVVSRWPAQREARAPAGARPTLSAAPIVAPGIAGAGVHLSF